MFSMEPKQKEGSNKVESLIEDGSYDYPVEFSVKDTKFPPMKEMKIGKEYMLMVCVKPIRMSVNKKEQMDMTLQIMEMGMSNEKKEDLKKEEELDGMIEEMYPGKKKNKK